MTESWRPVVGWPGYEVSDYGQVRSLDRVIVCHDGNRQRRQGRLLSVHLNRRNRRTVVLWREGAQATKTVYTLVLEAFVGGAPAGMEACHSDGDSSNDRLTNLRWDTKPANVRDSVRHGTHRSTRRTHCTRKHRLVAPNLVNAFADRGERRCKACNRAKSNAHYAKKKGMYVDLDADARGHYLRIMGLA